MPKCKQCRLKMQIENNFPIKYTVDNYLAINAYSRYYFWHCYFWLFIEELIVVISSELGPISLFMYDREMSQYTLKLCLFINNISTKINRTLYY